jgi:hypothetical protein
LGDPALKFIVAPWSERAAARLSSIKGSYIEDWARDVASGHSRLLEVHFQGSNAGFIVWTLGFDTVEVNAAACDPIKGHDMALTLFDFAGAMCKRHGKKRMRFETMRAGLVRKLKHKMKIKYVMESDYDQ